MNFKKDESNYITNFISRKFILNLMNKNMYFFNLESFFLYYYK